MKGIIFLFTIATLVGCAAKQVAPADAEKWHYEGIVREDYGPAMLQEIKLIWDEQVPICEKESLQVPVPACERIPTGNQYLPYRYDCTARDAGNVGRDKVYRACMKTKGFEKMRVTTVISAVQDVAESED